MSSTQLLSFCAQMAAASAAACFALCLCAASARIATVFVRLGWGAGGRVPLSSTKGKNEAWGRCAEAFFRTIIQSQLGIFFWKNRATVPLKLCKRKQVAKKRSEREKEKGRPWQKRESPWSRVAVASYLCTCRRVIATLVETLNRHRVPLQMILSKDAFDRGNILSRRQGVDPIG